MGPRRRTCPGLLRGATLAALVLVASGAPFAHPDIDLQIATITAEIEKEPDRADLFVRRGELYRIHREWAPAEADFRRAHELDPDAAARDFYIGRLKLDAQLPKQARKYLNRFLKKNPDHVEARVARARAAMRLGEPLAAARDFDRAVSHPEVPPKPTYYLERAAALAAAGDAHLERAIRGLDEGLARLGNPITLQLRIIDLELARKRYDAAIVRVDRIAEEARRKESWLLRKGEILELAARPGEALECYSGALAAIDELPASRRWNRAVREIEAKARDAVARLSP